ncbi:MAG: hypothetical protein HFH45_01345 [Bacilli bacterium]|jgi:hypothetical protein|nr:hypothetical protein [Bacilli bacterium]
MAKTQLNVTLSKDSFGNLAKQVTLYKQRYKTGVEKGIKEATQECYDFICKKMKENNLSSHIGNIQCDVENGKISTTDIVIIFHEFGTGIKGTQDDWADAFAYTVNKSGKGEKGWYFHNDSKGYEGITHGLTAKHIFYQALLETQKKLPKTIQVSVTRTIGDMY